MISGDFCALGCPLGEQLYIFPARETESGRRQKWLDYFDIEDREGEIIYACKRHFSNVQRCDNRLKPYAVPDIPVFHENREYFDRKMKNVKNVIVVTPKDPEFLIYKNQTGIFSQDQFQNENTATNTVQLLHPSPFTMPTIKSVSCSMSTQTNTRLCGSVQISELLDEYRLNCFYCSATFPLEKHLKFIKHLKDKHFDKEESFKMLKYPIADHDYTTIRPKSPDRINVFSSAPTTLTPKFMESKDRPFNIGMAQTLMKLLDDTLLNPNFRLTEEDNILVIKSNNNNNMDSTNVLKQIINTKSNASPEVGKRTVINKQNTSTPNVKPVLNQTVTLRPRSLPVKRKIETVTERILERKREPRTERILEPDTELKIEVDSESELEFLTDLPERSPSPSIASTSSSSSSRNIVSAELNEPYIELPPIKKNIFNEKDALVEKRVVEQTLKSINDFETVYKTVKKRHPRAMTSGVFFIKDIENNEVTEKQTSNKTPLNRCLKRANTETTEYLDEVTPPPNLTELIFEFTPRDIILDLLDSMKDYPVLWEFHAEADNDNYDEAIKELCEKLNEKCFLNLSPLDMRRSINRILNIYRYMLPCSKKISKFKEYFQKLSEFLPSSDKEIPRKRCEYCDICYARDSEMKRHLTEKHQAASWKYKCGDCSEQFMEDSQYTLHKHLPHYVELVKCTECNSSFTTIYTLARHKKYAHGPKAKPPPQPPRLPKKFKCDVCDKEFKDSSQLSCHKTYHKDKRFKCHLCPKSYFQKTTLTYHLKKHNQELDFVCEVCGKAFLKSSHLNCHMETHTGEKVTCNICNLQLRKCSLSRHLRLCHVACEGTIESTYRAQCYHYTKFVTDNKNSYRNRSKRPFVRTKEEGPRIYDCKKCNIPFDRLKFLKDHNNIVHADVKTMPCKFCKIQFRHTHNIKLHYRQKHNLTMFQIFKLHDQDMDIETVLSLPPEDVPDDVEEPKKRPSRRKRNVRNRNISLQDEIMEAVDNIDKQDSDQSMNEFFTDLLKHQ